MFLLIPDQKQLENVECFKYLGSILITPCINNIQHFNFQLTHTTLKNVELLEHF